MVTDDDVLDAVRLDGRHHRLDGQSGRSGRNVLSVGAGLGVILFVLAILDLRESIQVLVINRFVSLIMEF